MTNVAVILTVARGVGDNPEAAKRDAKRKHRKADKAIQNDETVFDPAIDTNIYDPGGGPCGAFNVKYQYRVDGEALQEAKQHDTDDDD